MIITVEELNKVESQYVYRDRPDLNLNIVVNEGQMRSIFYELWEYVEDKKLNEWLEAEGYSLSKNS